MTTELEALVGHLFVVDGRYINASSPGAMAIPAPRRAARGRDIDTFFGLIALSEDARQPASFYDPLIQEISNTYFKTSGSVTAALREAIGTANDSLLKKHRGSVPVGLVCAILREQELYIAITGPTHCIVVTPQRVEHLPDDDELFGEVLPLGVEDNPDIRFYHREVQQDDFLILSDQSMSSVRQDAVRFALESGEVDAALNNLRGLVEQSASAIVIKFVAPLPEDAILPTPEPAPQQTAPAPATPPPSSISEAEAEAAPRRAPLPFFKRASRSTALGAAKAAESTRTVLENMLPAEEYDNPLAQRFQLSTTMQIGVAVAVAVMVVLLTTFVYRLRGENSQYAQFVRQAQAEIEQARLASGNQAEARPHWEDALYYLDQATNIRTPGNDITDLRQEALVALDSFDRVTRVGPVSLRTYQPGAVLKGPVVQGLNLYLIDTTNDILYREDLHGDGNLLLNREPQIITRKGDVAGDQVVSGLIDLTWMEDGGVPQRNVLAVLSGNGLLITYSPSWDVTAALLPGNEGWVDPRAIAVYDRDLYILDAGANTIWWYEAGTDAYDRTPKHYFTEIEPALTDAIDMDIDSNGNIYVLHSSGQITKYFLGRPQEFVLTGLPQPIAGPSALFVNLSLFDRAFFVADKGGGRLYVTSVTGGFIANYKDGDNEIFEALTGVYSADSPPFVYVTAGNQLYYFQRP